MTDKSKVQQLRGDIDAHIETLNLEQGADEWLGILLDRLTDYAETLEERQVQQPPAQVTPVFVIGASGAYANVPTLRTAEEWRQRYRSEPPTWFTHPPAPLAIRIERDAADRAARLTKAQARMNAELAALFRT